MKKLMMVAGTLAALAAWSASPVQGQAAYPTQDTKAAQGAKADAKGKTMQLTGCLAKGADANSFVLSNAMASTGAAASAGKDAKADASLHADMKSYRVTAKEDLKLAGHVGHKVELTGQVDSSAAGSGMSGSAGTSGSTKPGDAGAAKPGPGASAGAKSDAMPQLTVTSMKHVAATCP